MSSVVNTNDLNASERPGGTEIGTQISVSSNLGMSGTPNSLSANQLALVSSGQLCEVRIFCDGSFGMLDRHFSHGAANSDVFNGSLVGSPAGGTDNTNVIINVSQLGSASPRPQAGNHGMYKLLLLAFVLSAKDPSFVSSLCIRGICRRYPIFN
jgi:hypothetical protein